MKRAREKSLRDITGGCLQKTINIDHENIRKITSKIIYIKRAVELLWSIIFLKADEGVPRMKNYRECYMWQPLKSEED